MYLVSRRAIAYDLLLNHSIYNPVQALIIILYTYSFRKAQETLKGEPGRSASLWELLKGSALKLLQIRALVSLTSVLSEYWLSLWSLERGKQFLTLSNGSKRLLLLKEMLLNMGWHGYLLKTVHQHYNLVPESHH